MNIKLAASISLRLSLVGSMLWCATLPAAEKLNLRAAKPDGLPLHVTVNVEVGGDLKVAGAKGNEKIPMSVVAQFGYDEQRLDDTSDAAHRMSLRLYDDTQAVIKIAGAVTKPQLRADRKLISSVAGSGKVYLTSPRGPLTREELELIDVPANTLILDELLPDGEVAAGHRWKPSEDAMAWLLCVDAVGHTEVECVLGEVRDGMAEITLEGPLGAAIDGVATQIDLKGKLLFDIRAARPKSLILAIKEQRGVGTVGPGLDVVAKLKLTIAPQPDSKLLNADLLANAKLPQTDEAPPLEYRSDSKGFRFLYDRRWHITRDEPDLMVMRFVNRGDLVAQCNVAPASKPIDKPVELADYQSDVQAALGKMFGHFERAVENTTPSGLRVLKAVAAGKAEDLAIQWRYLLVHDRQGRTLSIVFTMEAPFVEQFADEDNPVIESVEFLEPKVATGRTATHK